MGSLVRFVLNDLLCDVSSELVSLAACSLTNQKTDLIFWSDIDQSGERPDFVFLHAARQGFVPGPLPLHPPVFKEGKTRPDTRATSGQNAEKH